MSDLPYDPNRTGHGNVPYASRRRARARVDRLRRTSHGAPSSKEIVCYYCDEKGHVWPNCPKRLPPSDSHGTAREKGGVNPHVSGGHDGNANRSSTSHAQVQGSPQPESVCASTPPGEDRTLTAFEGTCDIFNTGA